MRSEFIGDVEVWILEIALRSANAIPFAPKLTCRTVSLGDLAQDRDATYGKASAALAVVVRNWRREDWDWEVLCMAGVWFVSFFLQTKLEAEFIIFD